MMHGKWTALGAATVLLIACYVVFLVSFALPWTTTDAEGFQPLDGPGLALAYGSMYLGFLLTGVLCCVYAVIVLLRRDWSWPRRGAWVVLLWLAAPLAMPIYFARHLSRTRR